MSEQSLVYIHDGTTGAHLDLMPCATFTWARALSAQSEGKATLVFDGTHTPAQWRDLTDHWRRMVAFRRPTGKVEFIGYILGDDFTDGESTKTVDLVDMWGMAARRGAWGYTQEHVEDWSTVITGSRSAHVQQSTVRARDTPPSVPVPAIPVLVSAATSGPSITRPYFGYFLEYLTDVWDEMVKEGLDIYLAPEAQEDTAGVRWRQDSAEGYTTGVSHDYVMGVPESPIMNFRQRRDSARVTNNSYWTGEGSERDMLIRSDRSLGSPLPLLQRVDSAPSVSTEDRLIPLVHRTLVDYGAPTVEWSFMTHWDGAPDIGDVCRFFFDGHREIPDGWHERRVIRVSGDLGEMVTVVVQPAGGL